ncbi:MFS transporter [Paenibacillus hamazuiensis]|uniref:MFS transporter n=1 Tax=Paenibacillus hamazuiensis TaxID=2936508 RepID=UPI00200E3F43|nr:MFS transporter [Paenibacillus hamazuiensis]
MKYKFVVMFLIVLCGAISIAVFNPIIGPLSRNLGLSEFQSGCLVSVTGLFWLLGGYFWEKITFLSSKRMLASVMFMYFATVVAFALLADYAGTLTHGSPGFFWIFLLLRAVSGFFFGGIPAKAQAYVMSWTTQETRTRGMALFGTANGLGFVLGPAMSGVMAAIGLTAPMYAAAALLFVMIIFLWISIPNEAGQQKERSVSSLSPLDPRIRFYLGVGLLLAVTLNILQVTIGFYVQDSLGFDAQAAAQLIGYGLAAAGVMVVASQIVASKYLKRRPGWMLRLGLLIVALGLFGLLAFIRMAYVEFIVLGIGFGFALLGYSASASVAVRDYEQRSIASYVTALQGSGAFLGPVAGTALYTAHMAAPYSVCALLIGFSFLLAFAKRNAAIPSPSTIGGGVE